MAKPNIIYETQRLYTRPMTGEDLPALRKILQDPVVMKAYEHPFSEEEVENWLCKQQASYENNNFGLWAVILKETGEMIGQCGLTLQEAAGEQVLEVGYLFLKACWHNGYATEAAQGARDYAFNHLGAKEVYSIIRNTNLPSMNVAIRNGMEVRDIMVKHYWGLDMPHYIFSVKNK